MESMPKEFLPMAKELAKYSRLVWDMRFVEANGGNLSVKIAEDLIITTPTMMSKRELTPDDMVVCTLKGDIVFGSRSPSSELHSHLAIYNVNENAKAIVHSHPPYATSYAFADDMPIEWLAPESVFWIGEICVIPFLMPGSIELSNEIKRTCKEKYVLFLKNHGLITWGESLQNAMWRTEVMESYCKTAHLISVRGAKPAKLNSKQVNMLVKLKEDFHR